MTTPRLQMKGAHPTVIVLVGACVAVGVFLAGTAVAFFDRPHVDTPERLRQLGTAEGGNLAEASPSRADGESTTRPPPSPPTSDERLRWAFELPSGNIACVIDGTVPLPFAACEIREWTYASPATLEGCPERSVGVFRLYRGSPSTFGCREDGDLIGAGLPILSYGERLAAGTLSCTTNADTGVTCTDTSTNHFFQVTRQQYTSG